MTPLCEYLDWDSKALQCRIARVTQTNLDAPKMHEILRWCAENSIDCLYALVDSDNAAVVRLLESSRFHFVDVRLTFETRLVQTDLGEKDFVETRTRMSREQDIPVLKRIAAVSYRHGRFYYDSQFSKESCDALYAAWAENSCRGYAQSVLVADEAGAPLAFVTCHLRSEEEGQIGLVGVDPNAKGQGLGTRIVMAALQWFSEQRVSRVTVVTQARNIAAQRLYQKCGFRTREAHLWYHRWFS